MTKCIAEDCFRSDLVAKQLCNTHYHRLARSQMDLETFLLSPLALTPKKEPKKLEAKLPKVYREYCILDDCNNKRFARNLCVKHHAKWFRNKEISVDEFIEGLNLYGETSKSEVCGFSGCGYPTKVSGLCSSHYGQKQRGKELTHIVRTKQSKNGENCRVLNCPAKPHSRNLCVRHYNVYAKYGEKAIEMMDVSKGCDSCGKMSTLCVDHDHTCCEGKWSCGKCIRGFLCNDCNAALGFLKDDLDRVNQLAVYLSGVLSGN